MKRFRKISAILLSLSLVLSGTAVAVPAEVGAAKKVKLSTDRYTRAGEQRSTDRHTRAGEQRGTDKNA